MLPAHAAETKYRSLLLSRFAVLGSAYAYELIDVRLDPLFRWYYALVTLDPSQALAIDAYPCNA